MCKESLIDFSRCCNGGYIYNGKWINLHQAYGFGWELIEKTSS